jgi:hypothetical protein
MTKDKAQEKAAKIYNAQKKPGDPAANETDSGYPEAGHEMKFPKKKASGGAMKATITT